MAEPVSAEDRRFLLVDGDPALAEALAEQLRRSGGFSVEIASPDAVIAGIDDDSYALAIVAAPAVEPDAAALIGALRAGGHDGPLLLLAASDEKLPGADAVLARPFRLAGLLQLIETLLSAAPSDFRLIGPYRFRPDEKLLVDADLTREIRLTEKEAAILEYLALAGDRTTTRELLLNEVWGYHSGVTTHTLETHVYRLRQKIETDPANAAILVSEPGGYRLAGGSTPGGIAMGQGKS
jgi:DNA-binding response OmpR family regulator